jgi:acetyl esterase
LGTDLLTPRMAALLERIRRANRPPWHHMTPAAARAAYAGAAEVLDLPRVALARIEDFSLPGGEGRPRPARLYAPAATTDGEPLPALLYFHGGGFVIGGIETHDALCRQLAMRSGVAVISLDYRLAPEHRFPAAFDDAFAALRALASGAGPAGIDARRLAVGGDSAGGTLAAAAALMARNEGPPVKLQVLITPSTAARQDSDSHRRFGQGFLLDAQTIEWFFDHAIDAADRQDWRFAPLDGADLDEALAPALVVLAECDPVVDEGLAYADRMRAAGVPVQLELMRGVTHDFIKMGRVLPEAGQALDSIARALQEHLMP